MNRVNFTIARLFWFAAALLSGFRTDAGSVQTASLRSAAIAAPASADGDSIAPIISADGRYVLFASSADNLVVNSNGSAVFGPTPAPLNVYLRDRTNHTTTLLSVNTSGTGGGNADSIPVEISADNRFALFESSASNLVNNDSNNASDIFVRDLTLGVTWLVSASTNGGVANGASRSSTMTPNGRYVAFVSAANNLVSSDTNGIADIFVRDLQSGSTACASRGAIAASPASGSESPMITPDGRYVAFYSTATGLVSGGSTSGDIYLRDMIAGQTFLASTNARTIATPIFGSSTTLQCYGPALSDDGHFVIYKIGRYFSGLSSGALIFRYNLLTGLTDIAGTSAAYDPGFDNARSLDVTPDGRFVVYIAGKGTNVYLWDGQSNTTTLVSADLTQAAPVGAICE